MPNQSDADDQIISVNHPVSIYPHPLSARRAKYEAKRARYHLWDLPRFHPYFRIHPKMPYLPAYILSRFTSVLMF